MTVRALEGLLLCGGVCFLCVETPLWAPLIGLLLLGGGVLVREWTR
jgi:hypothetical protein